MMMTTITLIQKDNKIAAVNPLIIEVLVLKHNYGLSLVLVLHHLVLMRCVLNDEVKQHLVVTDEFLLGAGVGALVVIRQILDWQQPLRHFFVHSL